MVELEPLLQTVVSRISEALHVSGMAVFLRENNRYQPAWATGDSLPHHLTVQPTSVSNRNAAISVSPTSAICRAPSRLLKLPRASSAKKIWASSKQEIEPTSSHSKPTPLTNIRNTTKIQAVVSRGKLYNRAAQEAQTT